MKAKLQLFALASLAVLPQLRALADDADRISIEYWLDNDRSTLRTTTGGNSLDFTVSAATLAEGLHTLCYRAKNAAGHASPVSMWMFYRTGSQATASQQLEYWVDGGTRQTVPASDSVVSFSLDATALAEGLHTLCYRAKDAAGHASPLSMWMFYRTGKTTRGKTQLEYWIDEGTHRSVSAADSTVALVLDASQQPEGLHTLAYRLKSADGSATPVTMWKFYRTAQQPRATAVRSYRIWWNDHQDKAVEVQLNGDSAEYLYEEQLAVPSYARNDGYSTDYTATFHIQFTDNQGHHSAVESATVTYPDIYPPQTVLKAERKAGTNDIELAWSTDKEDQVKDFNVYYSENGEPYLLWQPNTTQRKATFSGQPGTSYRFVVTASDQKGNYEAIEESKAVKIELK